MTPVLYSICVNKIPNSTLIGMFFMCFVFVLVLYFVRWSPFWVGPKSLVLGLLPVGRLYTEATATAAERDQVGVARALRVRLSRDNADVIQLLCAWRRVIG